VGRSNGAKKRRARRPVVRVAGTIQTCERGLTQAAASSSWSDRLDFPAMRISRPLWTRRSAIAEAAALLWNSLPHSLKGRLVMGLGEHRGQRPEILCRDLSGRARELTRVLPLGDAATRN